MPFPPRTEITKTLTKDYQWIYFIVNRSINIKQIVVIKLTIQKVSERELGIGKKRKEKSSRRHHGNYTQ